MNFDEGLRRIGLALGILGFLIGGIAAYLFELDVVSLRAKHAQFESLMSSPLMRNVAKAATDSTTKLRERDWFERNAPPPPLPPGFKLVEPERFTRNAPTRQTIEVNLEGINQVTVDELGLITSIALTSGDLVFRTDAPRATAYLIPFCLPVVGFLLPWGLTRIVTWIVAGFRPR